MRWKQNFIIFQIMGADLVILLGLPALFAFFKIAPEATLLNKPDKNKPKQGKTKVGKFSIETLKRPKLQFLLPHCNRKLNSDSKAFIICAKTLINSKVTKALEVILLELCRPK